MKPYQEQSDEEKKARDREVLAWFGPPPTQREKNKRYLARLREAVERVRNTLPANLKVCGSMDIRFMTRNQKRQIKDLLVQQCEVAFKDETPLMLTTYTGMIYQAWNDLVAKAEEPLRDRGYKQVEITLPKARASKIRKNSTGSKADDPKVTKAQLFVNIVNQAAELWAKGNRSSYVQVIKDMIANRNVREQNDGTVTITKEAMLRHVEYKGGKGNGRNLLPYGTLREWVQRGYLRGVPAAQRKN